MRIVLGLAALVIAFSPVAAADNPVQPASQKPDPSQKVICKTDREIGSMISSRECHTRAEWDQMANDAKESLDSRSRFGVQPPPRGAGGG